MNRTSTENQTENTSSSELTHRQKYRGLLKRSVFKDFRDNLFRYFDYIYTMASSHRYLSDIFRTIIFIQECVVAFFPLNKVLWPNGSLLGRILAVFSVASFICPTSVSDFTHFVVVIILYVFILLFIILFFSNLYIFLKMSKVHSAIVSIISIFLNVLQPYLINMISSHIGRDLYYIIESRNRIAHIFTFIFGVAFLIILLLFQTLFVAPSITFRPQVVHIMYSRYSALYNLCNVMIFFFSSIGSLIEGITGTVLCIFTIIPAGFIIFISFQQSIWAYIPSMVTSQAFSIVYCCFAIILPILSQQKIEGNEVIILCFIAAISLLIYLFQKFAESQIKKDLLFLVDIEQDESLLETISYTKLLSLLRYGFDNGHPICHTWKLFDIALESFNNDYRIVLLYAKYAAIYSDESNALQLITRNLKQMKHGSIELKYVLFQVNSLLQHRERGLSKSLKKTLSKIQDKTEKCRGQMR
ncbi:hypothetical protein TRFO_07976 [Tritrichomonas foetus]|uniref:Uncharacterized protein n=1 Tax=Tritrichomonas foetus TaxID=1144522 RepID=A0A1J4JMG9_9EUKA|nr:hypothetical protein TRFO_07976 [Tritrichomonas foetus]|eukprot:OHT00313.1 hypothetical protein TRFO_07976 [Tritrichomonas foetus]